METRSPFTMRVATIDDLERIVDITIAAADDQPLIKYIYPHRHEYPDDNRYCWTNLLRSMFEDATSKVLVAQISDPAVDPNAMFSKTRKSRKPSRVVAWTEWEWKSMNEKYSVPFAQDHEDSGMDSSIGSGYNNPHEDEAEFRDPSWTRRDDNPQHRQIWVTTKNKINEDRWSKLPKIMYLSALYTAPEYQGQGAGRMLKQWGLETAKKAGAPVGLIANHPPSIAIYKHWGFTEIEKVRMQAENEDQFVDISVLFMETT